MNADPEMIGYSRQPNGPRVDIAGPWVERCGEVLTPLALQLLASLHRRFNPRRLELLRARAQRQAAFDEGALPQFVPPPLNAVGRSTPDWTVGAVPADLADRHFEILGPLAAKPLIQALNSPASTLTVDFEDTCSPSWPNLLQGQINLLDALRGTLRYPDPLTGRVHRIAGRIPAILVRPRGWHLPEKHASVGGERVPAALFDFALYVANNHESLARRGSAPYFYLPKLESAAEARLWNDVFNTTQDALGIRRGTFKATILVETLPAAFEVDAMLHELREHCAGVCFGRWDYIFSFLRKLGRQRRFVLPERSVLTMDRQFLRSCVDLMLRTCQRRGARALLTEPSLAMVTRAGEAADLPTDTRIQAPDLLRIPEGELTEEAVRNSVRVGVRYVEAWLRGSGTVTVNDHLEDASSAEVCRLQAWQWLRHGVRTDNGKPLTEQRFDRLLCDELDRIHRELGPARLARGVFPTAARLYAAWTKQDPCEDFLTLAAYEHLN